MYSDDLAKAIKEVLADERLFKNISKEVIQKETEDAYNKVVEKCESVNLSNKIGSINKKVENNVGTISTSEPAIIFKEVGTGIKGSNNPHPDKDGMFAGWIYDKNGHGESGWWYPTDASDPNPTKKTCSDGTLRAWTKGLPASAMFYTTYTEMISEMDKQISIELNNIK